MAEATYFASVVASGAAANKRHLCLFNAPGSTKILKVFRVGVTGFPTAAVTGLVIPVYVARITTAPGGGGAGFIVKCVTTDANVPAQVTAMVAATSGATEESAPFGIGVVSGEETASSNESLLYRSALTGSKTVTCLQGQGIVVKQGALASAGALAVVVEFSLIDDV